MKMTDWLDFKNEDNYFERNFRILGRKHGLGPAEMEVYGYLFEKCTRVTGNRKGWCGLSDDNMANELQTPLRTFQRRLAELNAKGLIIIENSSNKNRRIKINPLNHVYIDEKKIVENSENEALKRLQKELEETKKQLAEAKREAAMLQEPANTYTKMLVERDVLPKSALKNAHMYNEALNRLERNTNNTVTVRFCLNFTFPANIREPLAYLEGSVQKQIMGYQEQLSLEKMSEDEKINYLRNKISNSSYYSIPDSGVSKPDYSSLALVKDLPDEDDDPYIRKLKEHGQMDIFDFKGED